MSVLRIYDPIDCDASGELLDWERCRTCADWPRDGMTNCTGCGGYGSLKAAVRAAVTSASRALVKWEPLTVSQTHRCESCSHPMGAAPDPQVWGTHLDAAMFALRRGVEPGETFVRGVGRVHSSACDSLCTHDGDHVRWHVRGQGWIEGGRILEPIGQHIERTGEPDEITGPMPIEASWRPVEVRRGMIGRRTLGDRFDPKDVLHVRPWDLRRENVALLCLRCFASPDL